MIAVERSDLSRCRAIVSEAPLIDPLALIEAFEDRSIVALESRSGELAVGIGEAFVVEAHGPDRFSAIRQKAARVFATVGHRGHPLRMFGGFAFEETDARFVLPRWLYQSSKSEARLTLTLRGDEEAHQLDLERQCLLRAFDSPPPLEPVPRVLRIRRSTDYPAMVSRALEHIGTGALEKVVLAHRIQLEAAKEYGIAPVLAGLGRVPGSVRFAFGRTGAFFAGATPELLVARLGGEVRSEAVAGSARPEVAGALLTSAKDRAEHGHVAKYVKATLERFAREVYVGEHELSLLAHVAHMVTPITARLAHPVHVLELAEALHPTPAVGGVPRRAACDFIRASERDSRGWYAGPIGWFDAEGDGELFVALRAARFENAMAHLFVGAGIVAGSNAEAESRETLLKAKTVAGALGARLDR